VGVVLVGGLGFLAFESWRSSRDAAAGAAPPGEAATGQEKGWVRRQVFHMVMIAAVLAGMFALLAVLVSLLRWQIG
jgi:hypothetical protein